MSDMYQPWEPDDRAEYQRPDPYWAPQYAPQYQTQYQPQYQQYQTQYQQYPPGYWPAPVPPPRRRGRGLIIGGVTLAVLAVLALVAGIAVGRAVLPGDQTTMNPAGRGIGNVPAPGGGIVSPAPGDSASPMPTPSGSADVATVTAAVDPGVVDINTTLGLEGARAAGTGIVLSSTGLILTNNHVINGSTQISVTDIGNGRTYTASVVGYDRGDDVAVLRLANASGLATVTLGTSAQVNEGDSIVAIGNAGGAGGTPAAAAGVVTALDQSITASDEADGSSERLTGMIQVAADVQPGDSGGPLVNLSGQVIGIDTAASAQTGANGQVEGTGQGYAIPIAKAMSIANQIQSGQGSTTIHIGQTGFLGVQITTSQRSRAGRTQGAAVGGVIDNTPAAQAGLRAGDVITSLNGQTVDSPTTLSTLMDPTHPGDRVKLGWVDLAGRSHTATLKLVAGPNG